MKYVLRVAIEWPIELDDLQRILEHLKTSIGWESPINIDPADNTLLIEMDLSHVGDMPENIEYAAQQTKKQLDTYHGSGVRRTEIIRQ